MATAQVSAAVIRAKLKYARAEREYLIQRANQSHWSRESQKFIFGQIERQTELIKILESLIT